jgi:MerR family transcriptional regulator, thiopeptide resistance regulator
MVYGGAMEATSTHTVSDVARLSGVTVRTLHHYDHIGLLRPSERTDAGYRLYDRFDLERLQEILLWRELGFGLDEIDSILSDPSHMRLEALRRQRAMIMWKVGRLQEIVAAIEIAMEANERGIMLSEEEMFEVFGDFDPREHDAEVEQRWSGELIDESRRRTASYGKEQWKQALAEGGAVATGLAELMAAGAPASSDAAMDLAEQHRLHIDRWFYPCSHEVHVGLGEGYVADPRFNAFYEKIAPGLAVYVRDAIVANAARVGR